MTSRSCPRSFAAIAGAILLMSISVSISAHAQGASQPAPPVNNKPASDNATTTNAATDQTNPLAVNRAQPADEAQAKSLTAKAIDKVRAAAKSAGDIFSRVPCLPPKGGAQSFGSLPRVAKKLVDGEPVVIIAFGSSSTVGTGASGPEFTYPSRLAAQLKRHYPTASITVINAGVGGEDAPEMMKRLQTAVIDKHPDLVIWQVGTNAVLRDLDPGETGKLVEDGVARIQAAGSDVVLVDPQYSPRITERAERASTMVKLLGKVAALRH